MNVQKTPTKILTANKVRTARASEGPRARKLEQKPDAEAVDLAAANKVEPTTAPDLQNEVRDARNDIIDAANKPAEQAKLFEALDGEQMQTRQLEEFQQLEETLQSVKQNPKATPSIQSAPTASAAEIKSGKAPATALPKGVDAVYVPSKNAIIVREGLTGKELKAAIKEEMGEWLGAQAEKNGVKVASGDVGARFLKVMSGQTLTKADFVAKASDAVTVTLNGKTATAKARTSSNSELAKAIATRINSGAAHDTIYHPLNGLDGRTTATVVALIMRGKPLNAANLEGLVRQGVLVWKNNKVLINVRRMTSGQVRLLVEDVFKLNDSKLPYANNPTGLFVGAPETGKRSTGRVGQNLMQSFDMFSSKKASAILKANNATGRPPTRAEWAAGYQAGTVSLKGANAPFIASDPAPKAVPTQAPAPAAPAKAPANAVQSNTPAQVSLVTQSGPVTVEAYFANVGQWRPVMHHPGGTPGQIVNKSLQVPRLGKQSPKLRIRTSKKVYTGMAPEKNKDGDTVIRYAQIADITIGDVKVYFPEAVKAAKRAPSVQPSVVQATKLNAAAGSKPIKSMTIDVTLMNRKGWHTDNTAMQYWDPNFVQPKSGEKGRWVEIVSRRKGDKNWGQMKLGAHNNYGGPESPNWSSGKITIPAQNGKPPIIRFVNNNYGSIGKIRTLGIYDDPNTYARLNKKNSKFTANDGSLLSQGEYLNKIKPYVERPIKLNGKVGNPDGNKFQGAQSIGHPVFKDGGWKYDFYNAMVPNGGADGRPFVENYKGGVGTKGVPGGKFANSFNWHDGGNVNRGSYDKKYPDYDVRINYEYAPTPRDKIEEAVQALPPESIVEDVFGATKPASLTAPTPPKVKGFEQELRKGGRHTRADSLKGAVNWDQVKSLASHPRESFKELQNELESLTAEMFKDNINRLLFGKSPDALKLQAEIRKFKEKVAKDVAAGKKPDPTALPKLTPAQINSNKIVSYRTSFRSQVLDFYFDNSIQIGASNVLKALKPLIRRGIRIPGQIGVFAQKYTQASERLAAARQRLNAAKAAGNTARIHLAERAAQNALGTLEDLGAVTFNLSNRVFIPIFDYKTGKFNKGLESIANKDKTDPLDYTTVTRLGFVEGGTAAGYFPAFLEAGVEFERNYSGSKMTSFSILLEGEGGLFVDVKKAFEEAFAWVKGHLPDFRAQVAAAQNPGDLVRIVMNVPRQVRKKDWITGFAKVINIGNFQGPKLTWDYAAREKHAGSLTEAQRNATGPDRVTFQALSAEGITLVEGFNFKSLKNGFDVKVPVPFRDPIKLGTFPGSRLGWSLLPTTSVDTAHVTGANINIVTSAAGRLAARDAKPDLEIPGGAAHNAPKDEL